MMAEQTTDELPRLYSASDIAREAGISRGRVYEAMRRGQLVPASIGGRYPRFTSRAVWAWMEGRRDGE